MPVIPGRQRAGRSLFKAILGGKLARSYLTKKLGMVVNVEVRGRRIVVRGQAQAIGRCMHGTTTIVRCK
jgi:hypothetical protein